MSLLQNTTKVFRHLSRHVLQLLVGSIQTFGYVPDTIQCCYRSARRPVASLSSTYAIALMVTAAGATTLTVRTAAIDTDIAVTTTYLEGGNRASSLT